MKVYKITEEIRLVIEDKEWKEGVLYHPILDNNYNYIICEDEFLSLSEEDRLLCERIDFEPKEIEIDDEI